MGISTNRNVAVVVDVDVDVDVVLDTEVIVWLLLVITHSHSNMATRRKWIEGHVVSGLEEKRRKEKRPKSNQEFISGSF